MRTRETFHKSFKLIEKKSVYWTGISLRAFFQLLNNLLIGYWFYVVIDSALAADYNRFVFGMLIGLAAMLVLSGFYGFSTALYEGSIALTTGKVRKIIMEKILRLPMKYKDQTHSGDLISRASNDVKEMERVYGANFLSLLSNSIAASGAVIAILLINWRIGLTVLILGTLTSLANLPFVNPLKKVSELFQKQTARLAEAFSDVIHSAVVTRVFGVEDYVEQTFEDLNSEVKNTALKRVVKNASLNGINTFSMLASFIGIMGIGFYFVLNGQGTVGQAVFIVQLFNGVTALITSAGNLITRMQGSLAGASRVFELLELDDEPQQYSFGIGKSYEDLSSCDIVMENISFAYGKEQAVLQGFSLQVPKGKTYALVGPSGCGKSTIMKLLLGFYEPHDGNIAVAGKPLSGANLKEYRKNLAYVPQSAYLYSGDIVKNIAYGNPLCAYKDIVDAAKKAYAHDFIAEFPKGYYSSVGEKGAQVSGGQRQRIAIARAIVKNAPVLLLDEATSSLDNESELYVQRALDALMKEKTCLVIAHRLSSIHKADKILVMDKGKIVQQGTHAELLLQGGLYGKLYQRQFEKAVS